MYLISYYQVYLYILKSLSYNFSTYTYSRNSSQCYFTLLCNNQILEWIETYKTNMLIRHIPRVKEIKQLLDFKISPKFPRT